MLISILPAPGNLLKLPLVVELFQFFNNFDTVITDKMPYGTLAEGFGLNSTKKKRTHLPCFCNLYS